MVRAKRSSSSSVLDFAILGLLKEQDLHGYEIRKRLGEILGPIARLSFGTLYPALNRLETEGAIKVLDVTKSRTGFTTERGRKIYTLTDTGTEVFAKLLETNAGAQDDDKAFAIRMAFARYLPKEARLRFLMHRREQLGAQLVEAKQNLAVRTNLDNYRRSLMEHSTETTRMDIAWLDSMIADEQQIGVAPQGAAARTKPKKSAKGQLNPLGGEIE